MGYHNARLCVFKVVGNDDRFKPIGLLLPVIVEVGGVVIFYVAVGFVLSDVEENKYGGPGLYIEIRFIVPFNSFETTWFFKSSYI